jgi:hypothetical protein
MYTAHSCPHSFFHQHCCSTQAVMPTDLEPGPLGPAFDEAIYNSPSTVKTALQAHAKVNRYAISCNSSVPTRVVYVCSKNSIYDTRNQGLVHESKRRKGTGTTKTNCKYRVAAKLIVGAIPNQWQVTVLDNEHYCKDTR